MEERYYHTAESVEEYLKLADGFDGAALIEQLVTVLPAGSKVLELGSGPGKDYELLSASYQVTGSDLSRAFLERLQTIYPEGEFSELNAATLETDASFDAVYSNKVLHHLTDEDLATSVTRQAAILQPGGIVCHSFWYGEGSEVFKGLFVNYHNEAALHSLFGPHFEIMKLETYAEFEPGDSLLLIARRKNEQR